MAAPKTHPATAPLVSFVVPAYNHEAYVTQCLDSVAAQTWRPMELIVVNDGSTDRTGDRIRDMIPQLEARFERFIYVDRSNGGICSALNEGLRLSRGPLWKYLASDDVLHPQTVERFVALMHADPSLQSAYCDGLHVDDAALAALAEHGALPESDAPHRFSDDFPFRTGDLFDVIVDRILDYPSPAGFFRTELLRDIGGFDESLGVEDVDLYLRVGRAGPMGALPEELIYHRIHATNGGRDRPRILSTLRRMVDKFPVEFFQSPDQRTRMRDTLFSVFGLRDLSSVRALSAGRTLVGWGTGGAYRSARELFDLPLDWLVDADDAKAGTAVDGLPVFSVDRLRAEPPASLFVAVLSQYRADIYARLRDIGLVEGVDYL